MRYLALLWLSVGWSHAAQPGPRPSAKPGAAVARKAPSSRRAPTSRRASVRRKAPAAGRPRAKHPGPPARRAGPRPILLGGPPVRRRAKKSPSNLNQQQLETIVVTGARRARTLKDAVTQTEVITRKQILQTSASRLSELLETRLGIQVTRPSGAGVGIQIQGLSSKHILLLVDGQRLSGRVRGVLDLDRFPLEQIERIEIVKGATSALYGSDAIGGVINIITRKNKRPFFANLSSRYGYGDSHLLDLSGSTGFYWKGWSGRLSISWLRHDAWDLDPKDIATTGSNDHQFQIGARTSYAFSKKIVLSLWGDYQYRDREGIDTNSVGAVYDRTNRTETTFVAAFLNALLSSNARLRWKSSFAYFRDQFLYEHRGGVRPAELQKTRDFLLQSVGQIDIGVGGSHFLSLGVDGLFEQIETPRVTGERATRGRIAAFAQYEWMIAKPLRVSIVPGIRAAYDSQYAFALNPKLSARIDPVRGLILRASYGWGMRAPDFKELYLKFENSAAGYVVDGNPQLRPEFARSLQIGVEFSRLKWLIFRANFYRNDLEDLINTRTTPGDPGQAQQISYENVDAAVTQGVETQLVLSYRKFVQLTLGYTYLWSRDLSTQKALLGRTPHMANASLFAQLPKIGLKLLVWGALHGPREGEDDADGDGTLERVELAPYLLLHARLSYAFWRRRFEVFVSVHNILGAGDPRWVPIRPRTFFAGLRFAR